MEAEHLQHSSEVGRVTLSWSVIKRVTGAEASSVANVRGGGLLELVAVCTRHAAAFNSGAGGCLHKMGFTAMTCESQAAFLHLHNFHLSVHRTAKAKLSFSTQAAIHDIGSVGVGFKLASGTVP